MFADLGLALDSFVVENLSLPEELQKLLDTRIGMNMLGDMNKYTQYQVANSMPIAAANEGGIAGIGAGLGAGFTMAQTMANALQPGEQPPPAPLRVGPAPGGGSRGSAPRRRDGDEVLHQLRQADAANGEILSGVRNAQQVLMTSITRLRMDRRSARAAIRPRFAIRPRCMRLFARLIEGMNLIPSEKRSGTSFPAAESRGWRCFRNRTSPATRFPSTVRCA